jgi:hypothetical protein
MDSVASLLNRRMLGLPVLMSIWVLMSIGVFMSIGAPAAMAQGQSPSYAQIRGACLHDYRAHCSGSTVEPGCLRQYWTNLSKNCRTVLRQRQSALGGPGEDKQ